MAFEQLLSYAHQDVIRSTDNYSRVQTIIRSNLRGANLLVDIHKENV